MLEHALFSVKIVLPIFILLGLGYALRSLKIIDEVFAKQSTRLLFYVIMPLKFIKDLWGIDRSVSLGPDLNLVIIVGSIMMAGVSYLISLLLPLDRRERGTFVQGCFRGNYVYIGYVLLERILGKFDPRAPLVLISTMVIYNLISVLLLENMGEGESRLHKVLHVFKKIITNPLLLGVLIGLALNFLHLPRPETADAALGYIGRMAMPLALLSIGATFRFEEVKSRTKPALVAAFIKLVLNPAVILLAASQMHFAHQDLILLYVVFGVPTAVSTYALVCEMDGDRALGAGIILYATALSGFAMMGFIAVFRALGWI